MNQFADAVIIGGGVIGTSIQFALAAKGIKNSILVILPPPGDPKFK